VATPSATDAALIRSMMFACALVIPPSTATTTNVKEINFNSKVRILIAPIAAQI
jgi:H+/gluconate symporter-like permease